MPQITRIEGQECIKNCSWSRLSYISTSNWGEWIKLLIAVQFLRPALVYIPRWLREAQRRNADPRHLAVKLKFLAFTVWSLLFHIIFTIAPVAETIVPQMKPWWKEIVILASVGCVSVAFLLLTVIICYKTIKRKPLRKEENGTSRGEYAMSFRNQKTVDTNNAVA